MSFKLANKLLLQKYLKQHDNPQKTNSCQKLKESDQMTRLTSQYIFYYDLQQINKQYILQ